jgi:hypothetical protein
LAETKTRLKRLDSVVQERLINWGYAICDAAMEAGRYHAAGSGRVSVSGQQSRITLGLVLPRRRCSAGVSSGIALREALFALGHGVELVSTARNRFEGGYSLRVSAPDRLGDLAADWGDMAARIATLWHSVNDMVSGG